VDASASGAAAGTVRRLDARAGPLPAASFALSSHGLGLAAAIELARALGQLPPRCIVYAIEGASFAAGAPLTPAVAEAAAEVTRRIAGEIAAER
jgi:hydrogenase maturation protease